MTTLTTTGPVRIGIIDYEWAEIKYGNPLRIVVRRNLSRWRICMAVIGRIRRRDNKFISSDTRKTILDMMITERNKIQSTWLSHK